MPDYSLDIAVAQAVEPMPSDQVLAASVCPSQSSQCAADALRWRGTVRVSPMQMWFYDDEQAGWYAGTVQESMDRSMRAYVLFWERTGWKLSRLEHVGQEHWQATMFVTRETLLTVHQKGTTAAIAICEAIKAASLADESLKGDSLQGDGKEVRSSETESAT
jgi:hypothetical protein